jgi:hypothetical protein
LRIRKPLLVVSFVLAYFLALVYSVLRTGTFAGLEEYALLVLAAVVFGVFVLQDRSRLGTAFLVFFNASRIFVLGALAAYFLNAFSILRLPLDNTDLFGVWIFPFGLFVILNFVYLLGFSDRKQRYVIFAWAGNTRQVAGAG